MGGGGGRGGEIEVLEERTQAGMLYIVKNGRVPRDSRWVPMVTKTAIPQNPTPPRKEKGPGGFGGGEKIKNRAAGNAPVDAEALTRSP